MYFSIPFLPLPSFSYNYVFECNNFIPALATTINETRCEYVLQLLLLLVVVSCIYGPRNFTWENSIWIELSICSFSRTLSLSLNCTRCEKIIRIKFANKRCKIFTTLKGANIVSNDIVAYTHTHTLSLSPQWVGKCLWNILNVCMHNANALVYSTLKSGFTLKSSRMCGDKLVGVVVVFLPYV